MKLNESTINKLSKYAEVFDEVKDREVRMMFESQMNGFIFGVESATDCNIIPIWNDGHIIRILCNDEVVYSSNKYDVWK